MKKQLLIALGVCLVAVPAFAQSVKEKKAWDALNDASKKTSEAIKAKCGVAVEVTPDKKSWNTVELAEGPATWCASTAASEIPYLCENDADYKAAVAKSLKKISCINDPSLPKTGSSDKWGNKFSMKGGTLEWRYHKDSANLGEYLREFLKESL